MELTRHPVPGFGRENLRLLNAVERAVPAGKIIEATVDNYATHEHPKVKAWLTRHLRWTFTSRRHSAPGRRRAG